MEKIIVGTVNSVNSARPDKNGNVVVDSVRNAEQAGTLTGNLGFWHFLHRFGSNFAPPTTNTELNQLGIFASGYSQLVINNQPTQYGQLINIPFDLGVKSTQLWIEQDSGRIFHRGGNSADVVNNIPFKRFLDTDDAGSFGIISGNVGNQNAWWVKFGGTIPLIIQGGRSSKGSFTYPIALSNVIGIWVQKIGFHWAFNPRITGQTNTAVTWDYTDQKDAIMNLNSFLLIVGY